MTVERSERKYLTETEVKKLMQTAKERSRLGLRDQCMIFMAFRHGLRRSELCNLKWSDVDLEAQILHVHRLKGSISGTHPIEGEELRLIRKYRRSQKSESPWMFVNQNGDPVKPDSFRQTLKRLGNIAGFPFKVHPHMLRHGCGYALVNSGENLRAIQLYMGHREIKNTLIYTELSPHAFMNFWKNK